MTSNFSTEIGRMRSTEMVARGLRYQELNRRKAEETAVRQSPARRSAPARVLAVAVVSSVVLSGIALVS